MGKKMIIYDEKREYKMQEIEKGRKEEIFTVLYLHWGKNMIFEKGGGSSIVVDKFMSRVSTPTRNQQWSAGLSSPQSRMFSLRKGTLTYDLSAEFSIFFQFYESRTFEIIISRNLFLLVAVIYL